MTQDFKQPLGLKYDDLKAPVGLIFQDFGKALQLIASVGAYGAAKYAPGNWRHVDDAHNRYLSALGRHLLQSTYETLDSESNLPHIAHAGWNNLALIELMLQNNQNQPQANQIITPTLNLKKTAEILGEIGKK